MLVVNHALSKLHKTYVQNIDMLIIYSVSYLQECVQII